ncbi:MAG: hypothetical protein ABFE01_02730 [Phycisphaerales bacterium]
MTALAVVLACAATAHANPCGPHPTGMVAWIVVVLAAMVVEVCITTGVLLFSGLAVAPTALVLFPANLVSYAGIVLPLYSIAKSVWLAEVVVLAAETGLIKLLSLFEPFQHDTFDGLKWRSALLAALAGNACSYYVGTLLSTH